MKHLSLILNKFTLTLIMVVGFATALPAEGRAGMFVEGLTHAAIALLFFLHGARLSRHAVVGGATHWRLHVLVFASTFVMFPLIGLALAPVARPLLGDGLWAGMLYLCALPGTVQSAIAFTSMARGNVPAAVCAASSSSLVGIVVTPLLVGFLLGTASGSLPAGTAILKIGFELLLPFAAGHLLRPWVGAWVNRNQHWLHSVDHSAILLVVYSAFGSAVLGGLWQTIPALALTLLVVACAVLLALVLAGTTWLARTLHFDTEDEITIVFCGSKKSLATDIPMAQILFAGGAAGAVILPLILFHQMQLMVCAVIARRYARRDESQPTGRESTPPGGAAPGSTRPSIGR